MSNRAFYLFLQDLDDGEIKQRLGHLLVYAGLELVSFLLITLMVRWRLHLSLVHQLVLVLELHRASIQVLMFCWIYYVMMNALVQFGMFVSLLLLLS